MNNKEKDKQLIFDLVKDYYNKYHKEEEYKQGDRINYASRVYDEKELISLVDSALDFWLTSGKYTEEFEKSLAQFLDIRYVSFVNSGSSANLLALACLTSPLLKEKRLQVGDEVITVACGFPTTINPIIQLGLKPVFLDVTIPEYNIDVSKLEEAYSNKTKAIMIAHTLGNPFDLKTIKEFCDKHNLWLIEDNCDALGSKYYLNDKEYYTGTIGDISTSSFYPAHHITTGEGGAVYTNNPLLHKIIRSLRDWGRDCICPSGVDNLCGNRFSGKYGLLPHGYDHKYVYSHFGYNLKGTDLQAAIGVEQLKKLPDFIEKRINNFNYLYSSLDNDLVKDKLILPKATSNSIPSWFGFPITVKKPYKANTIIDYLESNNIQTRKVFAGNIIKQPCFDDIRDDLDKYRIVGNLDNTDYIMENTFWIGVYPGMNKDKLDYMIKKIIEAVELL